MSNRHIAAVDCPDDEALVGLIEHRLPHDERDAVERHVSRCAACTDVVAAAAASGVPTAHTAATRRERLQTLVGEHAVPAPRAGAAARRARHMLAAGLLLAGAVLLGYGGGRAGLVLARAELGRRATAALGATVTIEQVGLAFARNVPRLALRMGGVSVGGRDDAQAMLGGDVELSLALAALLRGSLEIERIRLISPTLALGPPGPAAPVPTGGGGPAAGGVRRLVTFAATAPPIEIASGDLRLRLPDGRTLHVEHVDGHVVRAGDRLDFALAGGLGHGLTTAIGTVGADASSALTVTFGGHGLLLDTLPYLGDLATGIADVHLTVTGDWSDARVSGRVFLRSARTRGGNPLPGLLGAAAAIAAAATIPPELATPELPLDELRAAFAWYRGTWQITSASATSAGFDLSGSLVLDAAGELRGSAILRTPPGHAAAEGREAEPLALPFAITGTLDAPRYVPRF